MVKTEKERGRIDRAGPENYNRQNGSAFKSHSSHDEKLKDEKLKSEIKRNTKYKIGIYNEIYKIEGLREVEV